MKAPRNVDDLAARLSDAASKPVPLPVAPAPPVAPAETAAAPAAPREAPKKAKPVTATVQVTLRPSKTLLQRYTMAAADRTRKEGKVISAQQVMLECLERGP